MVLQLPGISYLKGYDTAPDLVGRFKDGFDFGRGLRDEGDAGSLIEELYRQDETGVERRMRFDALNYGGVLPQSQTQDGMGWLRDIVLGGSTPAPGNDPGSQRINGSFDAAARSADPDLTSYFASIRAAESGGNDAAKNPNSTATGRYQFTEPTWLALAEQHPELGLTPDGRLDPTQQEKGIRALTVDNIRALKKAGIPVSPASLYATHFLGAGDAPCVLSAATDTPLASILSPEVIAANPNLRDLTAGEFTQWAGSKGSNGKGYAPPAVDQWGHIPTPMRQVPRPSGELMRRLFQNGQTRPLAAALMQQDFASVDEYQTFRSDDGGLYQANVRTGEVKPIKAGTGASTYRTISDPAERASLGIDPEDRGVYQVDANGKVDKVGGGGVNVTVGGEGQYDKTLNENLAKTYITTQDESANGLKSLNTLSAMEQTMSDPNFYSGFGAQPVLGVKRMVAALGLDPSAATSMESFNALARNAALDKMGGSLGAGFSNADRDFVVEQVANLGATPQGNQQLIDIHRKLAQRQVAIGKLAAQYAEGNNGRLDRNWGTYLADWADKNPLFVTPGNGSAGAGGSSLPDPMGIR